MNIVKIITLSAVVLSILACSHSNVSLHKLLTQGEKSQLEPVYSFTAKPSQVSFIVRSHGCTLPEHFTLKQNVNAKGQLELALLRLKQDRCRAMPRAFPIQFMLDGQNIMKQNIKLLNTIETEQKLPRKAQSNNNRS